MPSVFRPPRPSRSLLVKSSRSAARTLIRRTAWPMSVDGVWLTGAPRSLRTGSSWASPASSRAAAEEKRSRPVLRAACVSGSRRLVELGGDLAKVGNRRLEIGFVGLHEHQLIPFGGLGDALAGVGDRVEEVVELLGALGDLGDPGGGLVDGLEGVAGTIEGLGRGLERLGRVGRDLAVDDLAASAGDLGRFPECAGRFPAACRSSRHRSSFAPAAGLCPRAACIFSRSRA